MDSTFGGATGAARGGGRRFPIGIVADCLKLPFREGVEACARLGADGVQLYAVSGEMAPENMTAAGIAEKKDILRSNGLKLSALCGDMGGHGFRVREQNPARVERSKRILDLALEMGSNIVTTHIGVVPRDSASEAYKTLQEACAALAEYAGGRGAYFAIETGPEPSEVLGGFLRGLGSKGMAVNFDPANLAMVIGEDIAGAVRELGPFIVHTHAKDGRMLKKTDPKVIYDYFADGGIGDFRLDDYFIETPLGQGDVDFGAYRAALWDAGYRGFLTIERETGDDPAADIGAAVRFLAE
ncbi:MAG: sugar phosphate isomerase/epimerase [Clostridiales bacterium]|jgi:sugar phosphate isomerase/epimerase|nr:sugar phosphate isomerase/epimerase [Clostridiales bacterium]